MSLSSAGLLTVAYDIVFKDGGTIGVSSATDAMTVSSGGIVTFKDDILIKDGGTIGSASDADSIAIAANGVVTFSQAPVFPDGSIAVADLDIDGATDIGAAIVDADLFIIDDGAGGTNRKTTASRLKTYVGGGISRAEQWRLTSNLTGSGTLQNLEKQDQDRAGEIDAGMTASSGVFTFPATGIWLINFQVKVQLSGHERSADMIIYYTLDDGSNWSYLSNVTGAITQNSGETNDGIFVHGLFDVTDTGNDKVKFDASFVNSSTACRGSSAYNACSMSFLRLGDT